MGSHAVPENDEKTWRITAGTRRDLLDMLRVEGMQWWGRLDETAFLSRIWDLSTMCSTDHRFKDAGGDIWQHRVNNAYDWPDDWIYDDSRFDLVHCDDQQFLAFLCETVHPVVCEVAEEAQALVDLYNDYLRKDDVQLVAVDKLGTRSVYKPRFRSQALAPTTAFDFGKYPLLSNPGALHDH